MQNEDNSDACADLAVVGGGAAGMFAAACAAEAGLKCLLLERKARLGSKVLMTANGRCNFTRDLPPDRFLADLAPGDASRFLAKAIRTCPPRAIIKGFSSLDIPLRRMPDGRMFPADGKAATIVHAFGDLLRDLEVPLVVNCPVTNLHVAAPALRVPHTPAAPVFTLQTPNFSLQAKNVLLATGGVSYPKTGSVGDGQRFAQSLGHTLVPYRPGLIGLETADPRVIRLAGHRFEDARAKVLDERGATLYDYRGEVDCERFGLSGAAIYNCQRFIEHRHLAHYTLEAWFDRQRLQFHDLRPRPVKEAIVTIGGVALPEIDPETMMSRKVPGLYFAGEVMDVDGPTGGYNITIAFATAHLAVTSIAARLTKSPHAPRTGKDNT